MSFFESIMENQYLVVAFISWFIAQFIKVIHTFVKDKKFNVSRFVGAGGMPSSHSAFVMGLSTCVGLENGWDSSVFAISIVFSLVVMYDAAGVRRAVGKQAIIVNKIIDDLQNNKKKSIKKNKKQVRDVLTEKRLKELVGHTPVEVFAGALLGIIIANVIV